MTSQILYADTIDRRWLKKQSAAAKQIIQQQIEKKLTTKPEIFGKPLRKSLKGYRRLRVGDYRVVFKIEDQTVKIVFIGIKPDIYQQFLQKKKD